MFCYKMRNDRPIVAIALLLWCLVTTDRLQAGIGTDIEGALINPVQTANVGTLVSGRIEKINFKEGDFMREGQVVAEIDSSRYELLVLRAESALKARQAELSGLNREFELNNRLLELDASTRSASSLAQNKLEVAKARVRESKHELDLERLNLSRCQVRAPFSGYLAVRYKQPHEPVERLEKVFAIVDSTKVYAVGNLHEKFAQKFHNGAVAVFKLATGESYTGRVERMARLFDPKSMTKRVYVLFDNEGEELEIGMLGTIHLEE